MSAAARAAAASAAPQAAAVGRQWSVVPPLLALCALAVVLWAWVPWTQIALWAAQEQRGFQTTMAQALRAIRGGELSAMVALCSATAVYGFVHALGPGHGKVLLGGAALASGVTWRRMAALTVMSSLMQAATAIALVACFALVLDRTTRELIGVTDAWLAPASAFAIAGIGVLLMLRGLRGWSRIESADAVCGCGHAHGPTAQQVKSLASARDAVALIASIGLRPCTGALFVLVIALRMDIFAIGCLAVVSMALGTAAFNLIVAGSGVAARHLSALPLDDHALRRFSAGVHVVGGGLIALASLTLLLSGGTAGPIFRPAL